MFGECMPDLLATTKEKKRVGNIYNRNGNDWVVSGSIDT